MDFVKRWQSCFDCARAASADSSNGTREIQLLNNLRFAVYHCIGDMDYEVNKAKITIFFRSAMILCWRK